MFGSPATSKDLNLPFFMSPSKQGKDESGLNDHRHQQQMTNGLLRYRSAPSSLFGEMCEDFLSHRSSSPEAETMLAGLLSPDLREQIGEKPSGSGGVLASGPQRSPQLLPTLDHGASETFQHQNGGFSSSASQMGFQALPTPQQQQQQQLTNHSSAAALAESSYRVESSVAMNNQQVKSGANGSNLIRHSSSPAGLFSHLSVENGLDMMRNMEGFRPGICSNGEATLGSSRLKRQISFSSRQSSSSVLMSQIPEIGNEGLDDCAPGDRGLGHGDGDGNGRSYIPGLPVSTWEDTSLFPDSFSGLKRPRDPPESQNGDMRNHFPVLSHHLSLPKNSSEMAAILQFQDAVPCKIRAKRGCATHPRSIAERVRRTRISERMRKLQELVPNMDKQTNTADMLDLAVEYIKDLQKQAKGLSESKANCTCSSK